MTCKRACYSYSKLLQCAEMVKEIDWTVKRKNEHFAKWREIKEVFQWATDNINEWLFNPDFELADYGRAAYNHKNFTKAELDKMLKRKYMFICNELNDILAMMKSGEVDSCDI